MSEQLSFDRAKGFVALPVEVLEIDLSPGAFRLLVELCRMANADGFCWPSLDQLSDRMGRSRSAISGYIKDLRNAQLVDTQTQKTSNGYNYRLKYRVTFWQDWRASLVGTTPQKKERSVQPAERLEESKKQIHKNHTPPSAGVDLDYILKDWAACFKGAPFPTANRPPTEMLISQTDRALASSELHQVISADITHRLARFWTSKSVTVPAEILNRQAEIIASTGYTDDEFSTLIAHLGKAWKHHWRRSPTPEQFQKLIDTAQIGTQKQRLNLLRSYRKRWQLAETTLRKTPDYGSINPNKKAAA